MTEYDIFVYGPIFCDLIFTGIPALPALGKELFANNLTISAGGSAIVAAGLQHLGAKVGLITDIGNDPISHIIWDVIDGLGLDRKLIRRLEKPLSRVTVSMSYPEDRAFLTYFNQSGSPTNLQSILKENPARHLHICSFLAALEIPDASEIAHQHGTTVSMDPGWDEKALQDPRLLKIITNLDVFLPSQMELYQIAQIQNLDIAAHLIQSMMPNGTLVVKQGAQGAKGFTSQNEIHVPAINVSPIDTTGAGDAFDAGFLYASNNNQSLETCLKYGAICGGLTTREPGGTQGFPSIQEVKKWL
jgi:sugar/nucleoside kinase (ribokinase family)